MNFILFWDRTRVKKKIFFSRLLVLLLFILLYVNDFVRRKTGNDPPQKVINSVVGPVLFFGSGFKYPSLPALILIPAPFYIKYLESIKSMIFFHLFIPAPSPALTNGIPVPTGSGSATLFIERSFLHFLS